jgi:UDP-2-acetamido-3-amino-2,3-dideoxy-glucuronate N-acetyltransferase
VQPRAGHRGTMLQTRLARGCTIGANATLVCGVSIGEFAFVGAGAVVTRDVAAFALVVGAPARRVGWVGRDGRRLQATADARILRCAASGETFRLRDGVVEPETQRTEAS